MSSLSRASAGTYGAGDTLKTGGVFPVWKEAAKTYRFTGIMIKLSDTYPSVSVKVSDLYPECMRSGTLIKEVATDTERKGMPMPIFRLAEAVSADSTKVVVQQGYGLPIFLKGIKVCPYGDASKAITLGNVTITNDGCNAEVTITANSLGVLAAGSYLTLEATNDWLPEGCLDDPKQYVGMDLATAYTDAVVCDGGRIDEEVCAGIPFEMWSKCLQTIKLY